MKEALLRAALLRSISHVGKLTDEDMLEIVRLGELGETQEAIALKFQVHQATVSRVQRALADTRPMAKQRLHAAAVDLATVAITASQIAATTGNADPALELLDRLDVAPRRRQDAPGAKIIVMVGHHDPSALPPLLGAARALPEASDPCPQSRPPRE